MSPDGLTLFFESNRDELVDIYSAERSKTDESFASPRLVPGISDSSQYTELGGPYLAGDGQSMYYHKVSASFWVLYQAERTYDGWEVVGQVLTMDSPMGFPVVTQDELTVYFAVLDETEGQWDVWEAERTSRTVTFENARPVPELNTQHSEFPSWLSPDDCRLYFDRVPDGNWILNVVLLAERTETVSSAH